MAFATSEDRRAYQRAWSSKNREHCREYAREYWQRMTPEQKRKKSEGNQKRHFKRKYGLSMEDWQALFDKQGGVCALCRIPGRTGRHGMLAVDHCHKTGRVRGLLCAGCNVAIAALGDNEAGLARALDYVRGSAPCESAMQFRGDIFEP